MSAFDDLADWLDLTIQEIMRQTDKFDVTPFAPAAQLLNIRCNADRLMVSLARSVHHDPSRAGEVGAMFARRSFPEIMLRTLAMGYAEQPGYRDEWKPWQTTPLSA